VPAGAAARGGRHPLRQRLLCRRDRRAREQRRLGLARLEPHVPDPENYLLPINDQALAALLDDLDSRGLLDETLVVWMGEFGRSPRIGSAGGRDHWPQCYTALLAGGGVKRGAVYGASDRMGAYPVGDPVKPDDLAATMFALLGIDPQSEVTDPLNRPIPIAYGNPVTGLLH
jgi:hypothetical protein